MEEYTEFSCTAGNNVLENSTVADALSGSLVTGSVGGILASVSYFGKKKSKIIWVISQHRSYRIRILY